jgi:hypothetical protein
MQSKLMWEFDKFEGVSFGAEITQVKEKQQYAPYITSSPLARKLVLNNIIVMLVIGGITLKLLKTKTELTFAKYIKIITAKIQNLVIQSAIKVYKHNLKKQLWCQQHRVLQGEGNAQYLLTDLQPHSAWSVRGCGLWPPPVQVPRGPSVKAASSPCSGTDKLRLNF